MDGDADAAVKARIRIELNKFRQLIPWLTNMDISLFIRGRLYSSCVQSSMLHRSENWGSIYKLSLSYNNAIITVDFLRYDLLAKL